MGIPSVGTTAQATEADEDTVILKLYATGTGSAKDVVCLDLATATVAIAGYRGVKQLPHTEAGNEEALVAGVALEAWTAAGWIDIQVSGVVDGVACASGVAVGDRLIAAFDTSNAGRCGAVHDAVSGSDTYATADFQLVANAAKLGVAMTAASSNTCTARLQNPQRLR